MVYEDLDVLVVQDVFDNVLGRHQLLSVLVRNLDIQSIYFQFLLSIAIITLYKVAKYLQIWIINSKIKKYAKKYIGYI